MRPLALAVLPLFAIACEMGPEPARPVPPPPVRLRRAAAFPASAAPAAAASRITPERVRAVAKRLEAIRGLKFKREVPAVFLTGAELRPRLAALFDADEPPEKLARESRLLKALGLVPKDADLRALYLKLLGSQVAGVYDPRRKVLYVVTDANLGAGGGGEGGDGLAALGAGFNPLDVILLHELDHALADQHHDLEALLAKANGDDDAEAALQCLLEGEATLAMVQFALGETMGALGAGESGLDESDLLDTVAQNLSPEIFAGLNENDPTLKEIPRVLVERLEAPYLRGLRWAMALWKRGGWAAIDGAFARPPKSSREILFPATRAAAPAQFPPLPPGAKALEGGRLGALDCAIFYAAWGAGPQGEAWARGGGDGIWRSYATPAGDHLELLFATDGAGTAELAGLIRKKIPAATIERRDARRLRVVVRMA